jgi:hypothetical protein
VSKANKPGLTIRLLGVATGLPVSHAWRAREVQDEAQMKNALGAHTGATQSATVGQTGQVCPPALIMTVIWDSPRLAHA